MTLVEFLRARLGEDEAAALGVVNADGETYVAEWTEPLTGTIEIGDDWPLVLGDRRLSYHVARWDPARALAEVEATRRILADHEAMPVGDRVFCRRCGEPPQWGFDATTVDFPCPTLLALALPYAGHPDFDPAWR
jgi:hypothetical protein